MAAPGSHRPLGLTVPDIANAITQQNQLTPAGQIGGPPAAPGTEYTYTVRTQGRLFDEHEFGAIILRTMPDGSQVHLKDVARLELGTMLYNAIGRHDSKPAAVMAVYRTVVYFQDRLDGGVSNRLEVDRIKSNRAQTAAAIPDFERQVAVAEHALSLLLGRTPGAIARATAPSATGLGPPPSIPPGLPASLLERRPDVVQAEQLLVAANANVGVAKALFFPAINLTGFLGGVSGDLTTMLGNSGGLWSIGGGLLQPIFNAGRLKHNLESARAAANEAVALYQKAALNGYREVANALISIQKIGETRIERQAAVDALRDAADLARSRYESGLASYLKS